MQVPRWWRCVPDTPPSSRDPRAARGPPHPRPCAAAQRSVTRTLPPPGPSVAPRNPPRNPARLPAPPRRGRWQIGTQQPAHGGRTPGTLSTVRARQACCTWPDPPRGCVARWMQKPPRCSVYAQHACMLEWTWRAAVAHVHATKGPHIHACHWLPVQRCASTSDRVIAGRGGGGLCLRAAGLSLPCVRAQPHTAPPLWLRPSMTEVRERQRPAAGVASSLHPISSPRHSFTCRMGFGARVPAFRACPEPACCAHMHAWHGCMPRCCTLSSRHGVGGRHVVLLYTGTPGASTGSAGDAPHNCPRANAGSRRLRTPHPPPPPHENTASCVGVDSSGALQPAEPPCEL